MKILNGYVLVKKPTEINTNPNEIQYAEATDSFIYTGEVVHTSSFPEFALNVGDIIVFKKHSGEQIPVNGENMQCIHYKDIIAIK